MGNVILVIGMTWMLCVILQMLVEAAFEESGSFSSFHLQVVRVILAPLFLTLELLFIIVWLIYKAIMGIWYLIKNTPAAFLELFNL